MGAWRTAVRSIGRASVLCLLGASLGAQEAPRFRLDLDTGGHRAIVRALGVSADGATLVSASADKTLRVWDIATGETRVTLRGRIGPGNEGVINALALSPDGRRVAAGGYFGPHLSPDPPFGDIRIFDTASGQIVKVLRSHAYVVEAIAYDPARNELAVSGQGGMIHRWRAPFTAGLSVPLPPLDTGAGNVSHLAYARGGTRLIATTRDYGLRVFDSDSGADLTPPDAEPLWDVALSALAVSADGARFALGGEDGRIELRDAATGTLQVTLPVQPFRPDALAFVGEDGLLIGCGYRCGPHPRATVLPLEGDGAPVIPAGHGGAVTAAAILPDGRSVITADGWDAAIHLWDGETGVPLRRLGGIGAPVAAVGLSPDGATLGWGGTDPCPARTICPEIAGPLTRMIALPTQTRSFTDPHPPIPGTDLLRAETAGATLGRDPQTGFEGALLSLDATTLRKGPRDGFYHAAFTLWPGVNRIVTGGANGALMAHDSRTGDFATEYTGHTGDILALALAPGANRLLSGSADQTMKLWNAATGDLIASFFAAGQDWILWTPQGYYHSSPDGDRLVGWHVDLGGDSAARFIRARQLRRHLNSPEIVRQALISGDPAGAARGLRGTDSELGELLRRKPPEFDIRLADEVDSPEGFVTVEITGASLEAIDGWGYSVLVNERRVPPLAVDGPDGRTFYRVPVSAGTNAITVSGENDFGYITERSAVALSTLRKPERRGTLYVAVVGIADYPLLGEGCAGRSCDLAYPVADAVGMLTLLAEKTAPLFADMHAIALLSPGAITPADRDALSGIVEPDDILEPDAANVRAELLDFLARPGPDDTTILFVAGHGMNLGERFFLIPSNGERRGEEWRMSSLVNWEEIKQEIGYATGRRILILDTCHAAGAHDARMEKDAADTRVIVLSATAANNVASERRDLGHGIFTYALLEGLRGKADSAGDGVRVLGLADYVYREVMRLSNRRQEPFYHLSQTANFLLAPP